MIVFVLLQCVLSLRNDLPIKVQTMTVWIYEIVTNTPLPLRFLSFVTFFIKIGFGNSAKDKAATRSVMIAVDEYCFSTYT